MVNITDGTYDFLYISDDGQQWPMKLPAAMAPSFWTAPTYAVQGTDDFNYTVYVYANPQQFTTQLKRVDGYVTDYTNRTIFGPGQDGSQAAGPKQDINNLTFYTGIFAVSPQATDINGQTGGLATGGGTIGTFDTVTYAFIATPWAAFNAEIASPIYDRPVTWTS
ncbi:MAG TPA: hypothetical protein VKB76_18095, partial [Ktedonobacterales bacterium]|nr:hypothetical protein [Ktedonobacterales bacterium]